jgi:hypothetical protein
LGSHQRTQDGSRNNSAILVRSGRGCIYLYQSQRSSYFRFFQREPESGMLLPHRL